MKILLINQSYYPDLSATAQHLTDFSLDLVQKVHEVTILTAQRGYVEPHPVFSARENYQGVKIIRVWPFSFGKKIRLLRILDALFLNLSFAAQLFWQPRFDTVIAMTSPPLVAWIAVLFAKLRNSRFIYWMMDVNPDEAIEAGWIPKNSFRAKILEGVLEFTLKKSDSIVVLDEFMKERIVAKGALPEKVSVIPPWAHDEDLETIPHDKNPFRKQFQLNGRFVVMYSGNHSICHPLDTVLEAARSLKDDNSIMFIFVGGGERTRDVLEFKEKFNLSNIVQLPYQPRDEMKYSLSAADLHTIVMGNQYVGIVHPSKIYGILQISRPFVFIGQEDSPIGRIIREESFGRQVDSGDVEKLVEVIRETKSLSEAKKSEAEKRMKNLVSREYSRKVLTAKLLGIVLGEK